MDPLGDLSGQSGAPCGFSPSVRIFYVALDRFAIDTYRLKTALRQSIRRAKPRDGKLGCRGTNIGTGIPLPV